MQRIDSDSYALVNQALRSVSDCRVLVACEGLLFDQEIESLLQSPRVAGLVIHDHDLAILPEFVSRIGTLREGEAWSLPEATAPTIIFLADTTQLGVRRVAIALRHGVRWIVLRRADGMGWERQRLLPMLIRSGFLSVFARFKSMFGLMTHAKMRPLATAVGKHLPWMREWPHEHRIRRTLSRAIPPLERLDQFVSERILLVSSSLGPGGAERQVVNTIAGLVDRGYRDVSVLCRDLSRGADQFYRPMLKTIGVCPIECGRIRDDLDQQHRARLEQIMGRFTSHFKADVAMYAAEFLHHKPSVVHAWQDETCIKAGLAAVIVGVPRIVLSGRSVAPYNFALYQPYMRGGLKALAEVSGVVLVNNSIAGAESYAKWLGIAHERVRVVHNGFDFAEFQRPNSCAIKNMRARLGIAPHYKIVGTMIRFSEEKRPLLWVDVAASIARERSDVAFLMFGTGPMKTDVAAAVKTHGLSERFVLPGTEREVALALGSMDVFLLTSRKEGLPNVLIEAQAIGVPVVSTDAGGASETFLNGVTGYLTRSDTADEIASRVLSVLDDANWRKGAVARAPQLVQDRFCLDRMVEQTIKLYSFDDQLCRRAKHTRTAC